MRTRFGILYYANYEYSIACSLTEAQLAERRLTMLDLIRGAKTSIIRGVSMNMERLCGACAAVVLIASLALGQAQIGPIASRTSAKSILPTVFRPNTGNM